MTEKAKVPEVVPSGQTIDIGGVPVPLSPQLLQALSGVNGALANLNPVNEIMALADEPKGSLLPMMLGSAIERKKHKIIAANVAAKRLVLQERTALFRAAADQVRAVEELAEILLASGSLTEVQRLVLGLQFPELVRRDQQRLELEDLEYQAKKAEKQLKLDQHKSFTRAKAWYPSLQQHKRRRVPCRSWNDSRTTFHPTSGGTCCQCWWA